DSGDSVVDATPQGVIGVSVLYPNASPYIVAVSRTLRVGFGTGTELLQFTTGDVLTRNTWNHVVVTFGETAGMFRVYVNGVLRGSYDAGSKRVSATSYAAHMTQLGTGGQPGDFSGNTQLRLFHGKLDDVVIYREALSAEEVNELFRSGAEAVVLGLDDPPGGSQSS
ncbi:MAG: LamG-like jellyroll fold domain-containing protein, partial [Anaerolineae bacterium]